MNAIVCGTFHTDSLHASIPTEELQAQMAANVSLGRIASADEIVGTALYLASDASSYLTGELHRARRRLIHRRARTNQRNRRETAMTDDERRVIGAGRVAVVTGAASGIGRALGRGVRAPRARRSSSPISTATRPRSSPRASAPTGGEAEAVAVDVSDAAAVDELAPHDSSASGRVDVLCNNAGVSTFNLFRDQTLDDWRWVFNVNLWGVVHGVHTLRADHARAGHARPHRQHRVDRGSS